MGGDNQRRRAPADTRGSFPILLTLLTLLTLLAPSVAQAGGTFSVGPATIVIDDSRGAGCASPALGFCQAEVGDANDPGGARVDARQNVRYAGVALEPPVHPPIQLLPDGGLFVRPGMVAFYVPYRETVFVAATAVDGPADGPLRWKWHEDASVELFYPEVRPATKGYQHYSLNTYSGDMAGPSNGTLGLRNLAVPLNSTDGYVIGFAEFCTRNGCRGADAVSPVVLDATPNVETGFAFVEAGVATDPDDLGARFRDNRTRSPAAGGAAFRGAGADAPRLSRDAGDGQPRLDFKPADAQPEPPETAPPAAGERPAREAAAAAGTALERVDPPPWAAVAAGAAAALAALLGLGLYSRIRDGRDALRSPVRGSIHQILTAQPGIAMNELAVRVGLSRSATLHHARILEKAGLARVERHQGRALLFPRGGADHAGRLLARRLAEDPVFRLLADEPGLTRAEIHGRLAAVPVRTRNHRLKRLLELDLVRIEGDAGRHYLRL